MPCGSIKNLIINFFIFTKKELEFKAATSEQLQQLFTQFFCDVYTNTNLFDSDESNDNVGICGESNSYSGMGVTNNENIAQLAQKFSSHIPEGTYTMSQIQGILQIHNIFDLLLTLTKLVTNFNFDVLQVF
jgi:hypothetical protein